MQGRVLLKVIVYTLRVVRNVEGSKRRMVLENEISDQKSRGKKTIQCYKCKQSSNMKKDCPTWRKQNDEKQANSSKSVNVVQNEESDHSDRDMLSVSTT